MTDKEFLEITKLDPAKPYPHKLVFDITPLMIRSEALLAALHGRLMALGYVQTAQQSNPDGMSRVVLVRAKVPPLDPRELLVRARAHLKAESVERSEHLPIETEQLLRDIDQWLGC